MRLLIILAYYMHYIALSILMLFALQASNCGRGNKPQRAQSALISALQKDKPEKVSACLRQDADPNTKDANHHTPLHWACYLNRSSDLIKMLLDAGAEIDAKDKESNTPLHWACDWNTEGDIIITMLLDAGAKIDAKDGEGKTPLDRAWSPPNTPNTFAMKQLIQKAVDQNNLTIRGEDRKTLLHYAAALEDNKDKDKNKESHKIVEQLLALKLDPNAKDDNDCTPLDYAQSSNVIVQLLLHSSN
ncbi:ankyrin repeat domain-containing protein [Cardinium endosymbiont of Oedothorax gibbosus]|uniref:ankyrin repeat domain-containing protein n=1 Tax=Cardinium endosymbiont of Oedothorax gibbosus TaxID=931101 RepID=UPI00202490D1|nr:ankyrin repeat domain-containing protein [Cardinium endosymbiont of Oedothorax gibbosus]CAH2559910.1 Ankyrin-repeat-containing protein [Cardinium endosymbiont of Oedothorax gibbosus]